MIEECEWTPTWIIHEIVADLESIQGIGVEWEHKWPFDGQQHWLGVSTIDGRFFEVQISITEVPRR